MFADERRQVILELVRAQGAVAIKELARIVQTSEVTVRRDLRVLESGGLIDRRHGGAVAAGALAREPTHSEKAHQAAREKAAIAAVAAGLVGEGDVITIGAGTTTQAFARRLTRLAELTVMTNSLLVAQVLARSRVDVVMTGGSLRGSIYALVGTAAEHTLASIRTGRAFISGNGLTAARGLSTPNMLVAGVDRSMVESALEVVVLVDHTKLGIDTMVQTVPVQRIAHLVTDDRAPEDEVRRLREAGVTVHIATPGEADPVRPVGRVRVPAQETP